MTQFPDAFRNSTLIAATVVTAVGLNFGVMALGQGADGGSDVETAASVAPTETTLVTVFDATLMTLATGTTLAADTTLASDTVGSDTVAPDTAAAAPAGSTAGVRLPSQSNSQAATTAGATTSGASSSAPPATTPAPPKATSAPQTPATQAPSTAAPATTPKPATTPAPTTAKPTTTTARPTTTAKPTTTTASTTIGAEVPYTHDISGVGSIVVTVRNGSTMSLTSANAANGWSYKIDTNQASLIKVQFTSRRNGEVVVTATLRNGELQFNEERSND